MAEKSDIDSLSPEARKMYSRAVLYPYKPKLWVIDFFGENIRIANERAGVVIDTETGLTVQQEGALEELGKLIGARLDKSKGLELTAEQEEYAEKMGISIMSGKGTGKDFWSALVSLFFLTVFNDARGLATANTGKQLKNVFWSEIAKVISLSKKSNPEDPKSKTLLEELFEWQSEKVFRREKGGRQWFMEAVTVNPNASSEEQAKALTGRHEDYMLFIIDEAIGVPEPALMALEETMTGKLNIAVMIFNPFRSRGYAIDSQYKNAEKWVALRWNAEECERVTADSIEKKLQYGRDSNPYRVGVLGLPPVADSDTLFPVDWIMDAVDRPVEVPDEYPLILGGDFGAGGDNSVICPKRGPKVYDLRRNNTQDSNELIAWVQNNFYNMEADAFFGDVIGIGWAVMGSLRELLGGHKVRSVDSRAKARREDRFHNKRAENAWMCRVAFENGLISIPDDENLIDQLSVMRKKEDTRGRTQIISKMDIKKELKEGGSPDEADALFNCFAHDEMTYMKIKDEDLDMEPGRKRLRREAPDDGRNNFAYV